MKYLAMLTLTAMIAVASPASLLQADNTVERSTASAQDKKFGGTAKATFTCSDGSTKVIMCNVSGEATFQAAKDALSFKIKSEVASVGGKVTGSVQFSISAEW